MGLYSYKPYSESDFRPKSFFQQEFRQQKYSKADLKDIARNAPTASQRAAAMNLLRKLDRDKVEKYSSHEKRHSNLLGSSYGELPQFAARPKSKGIHKGTEEFSNNLLSSSNNLFKRFRRR